MILRAATSVATLFLAVGFVAGCAATSDADESRSDDVRARPGVPSVGQQASLRTLSASGTAASLTFGGQIRLTTTEIQLRATELDDRADPTFTVPKTADFENFCHVRTIRGIADQRPSDGFYTEITVIDRSHTLPGMPCTTGAKATSVVRKRRAYSRIESGEVTGNATFEGDALEPIPAGPNSPVAADVSPGLVKLYTDRDARPSPGCDVHTNLVLASSGGVASASMMDVVSGFCEIFINPNPRTYAITAKIDGCGSKTYAGTTVVEAKAMSVKILDHRARLCDDGKKNAVEVEEQSAGAVVSKVYSLSSGL